MKRIRNTYSFFQLASAAFMVVALLWLSVSAPFVNASQQEREHKTEKAGSPLSAGEEESSNPFGNSTEEKASSNSSFSEEYLHDHHTFDHFFSIISRSYKCENAGTYVAFHGELLVPPPNAC